MSGIPVFVTVLWAVLAYAAAHWAGVKDDSARPIGLVAAVVIAPLTAWTWFTSLAAGWSVAVVLAVVVLFVIGMIRPDAHDNIWHYSALVLALFGKALAALLVAVGNRQVPLLVAIVLIAVIMVMGIALTRRPDTVSGSPEPAPDQVLDTN